MDKKRNYLKSYFGTIQNQHSPNEECPEKTTSANLASGGKETANLDNVENRCSFRLVHAQTAETFNQTTKQVSER